MFNALSLRDLVGRLERVWHDGHYESVSGYVAPSYAKHAAAGEQTIPREARAADLARQHPAQLDTRFVVNGHTILGSCAWCRFTVMWVDRRSGETHTRAGTQAYRLQEGKLAETWLTFRPIGSAWGEPGTLAHRSSLQSVE